MKKSIVTSLFLAMGMILFSSNVLAYNVVNEQMCAEFDGTWYCTSNLIYAGACEAGAGSGCKQYYIAAAPSNVDGIATYISTGTGTLWGQALWQWRMGAGNWSYTHSKDQYWYQGTHYYRGWHVLDISDDTWTGDVMKLYYFKSSSNMGIREYAWGAPGN